MGPVELRGTTRGTQHRSGGDSRVVLEVRSPPFPRGRSDRSFCRQTVVVVLPHLSGDRGYLTMTSVRPPDPLEPLSLFLTKSLIQG